MCIRDSDDSVQWSYNYWSNGGHNQNENITAVNHRSNLDKDVNNVAYSLDI